MAPLRRQRLLAVTNTAADWATNGDWLDWPPPENAVHSENHVSALLRLAGPPRALGYLIPVPVTFVRDLSNDHDRSAYRAEIDGEHVGFLAAKIARQTARAADRAACFRFTVCGLLRGGTLDDREIGVYVWLDRTLSSGVDIVVDEDDGSS